MFKKIKLIIPFLLIPIITPLYLYFHINVFISIFGCGCVPSDTTNILNIPINTNDLRLIVYSLLVILTSVISIIFSKNFKDKRKRLKYCSLVFIVAVFNSIFACSLYVWK